MRDDDYRRVTLGLTTDAQMAEALVHGFGRGYPGRRAVCSDRPARRAAFKRFYFPLVLAGATIAFELVDAIII